MNEISPAEGAERRAATRLRQILQGALDHAIIEIDLDRTVRGWSPGAERLFGWTEREVLGRPADLLFTPEDRALGRPAREIRQAIEEGRAEDTCWHMRRDGSRCWKSGCLSLLTDEHGRPDGLLKIARDHSHTRQAEEALLGALDAATRANDARARMMATAGHDLRQPVQVIAMVLDRLTASVTDERGARHLGLAADALARLGQELESLALRAATEDGFGPQLSGFPVQQVLARVPATWRHHAEAKDLRLVVRPCAALVRSDPAMLATIVDNLVGNAIKYTERGGVLVGCRHCSAGRGLTLSVVDTGIGIAPEACAAIFDPLRQLDATRDGLGLGLSIVHRTAGVLGHPVGVRSVPGRGSHFTVTVPVMACR